MGWSWVKAIAIILTLSHCSCSHSGRDTIPDTSAIEDVDASATPPVVVTAPSASASAVATVQPLQRPSGWRHFIPTLTFDSDISDASVTAAVTALAQAQAAGAEAVLVLIDSPGGDVSSSYRLMRAIESSKIPVYCLVDGKGYSMAAYALQSCSLRLMTKRSTLMLHEVSSTGVSSGTNTPGSALDLGRQLERMTTALVQQACSRICLSPQRLQHLVQGRQLWLTAAEASAIDAVDAVLEETPAALEQQLQDRGRLRIQPRPRRPHHCSLQQ